MSKFRWGFFALVSVIFLSVYSIADEGMWVFNNLPTEKLKNKYDFDVTPEWSEHVMKGSVRFNSGGSGSFVSADGLVITNHHVASDTLQKISSAEHDYLRDGFFAKTAAEEIKTPDLELNQLVSIENVTDGVNAAVKPEMSPEQAAAARKSAIAGIEKESFDKTGLRSDVITLYQGGQYHLYRYQKYTDVRLVFAPEASIAFFGGDADNFEFPRYDLDVAFFRVYENGQPVKPKHYFPWSPKGASAGELVFVSGSPGRTSRMFTADTLKFLRDVSVPYTKRLLNRREVMLQQYSKLGPEQARQAKGDLFSMQNSRKVFDGRLKGLQDKAFIRAKQQAEAKLRGQVQSDEKLKAYAGAWEEISATLPVHEKILARYSILEGAQGFNSRLYTIARTLVRLADEDKKPNAERLAEFRDSNRASLEQQLFSAAPLYNAFEAAKLADSLQYLVSQFGHDNELVKRVLGGKDPQARALELVNESTLSDIDTRRYFAKGGAKAIKETYDPMIDLAKLVDAASRKVRKTYETTVEEPQRQAYAKLATVLFAIQGTSTYPDATFTLRLSYGEVKGYSDNGKEIAPFTTIGQAFKHAETHQGQEGYTLPKSWVENKDKLNPETPFNFVSTNDIIGGNSGSPVINRAKQFVGIIFDGNIQSLTGDYQYSDEKSRAVSVDSNAVIEALRVIYGAQTLVDELMK